MRVCLVQFDIVWNRPSVNLLRLEELLKGVDGVDAVVMPEMFSTGFVTDVSQLSDDAAERSLNWMRRQAALKGATLLGSMPVKEAGRYYNRLYVVRPDGSSEYYDKRHLFSYGGEQRHYAPGQERVVVELGGLRCLLQVCYDLRFPVFSRNRCDYDAIVYVANWPTSRLEVWRTLLKARAIENQCYVVGVNRCGRDPLCEYAGSSAAIDAYGRVMAEAGTDSQEVFTVDLPLEPLQAFRRKFPVLADADSFSLLFSTTNDKKQEPIYE